MHTQTRFQTIGQSAMFAVGRLEGLAYSTRFGDTELNAAARKELLEIADQLKSEVDRLDQSVSSTGTAS